MRRPQSVVAGLLIALTVFPGAYADNKGTRNTGVLLADESHDPEYARSETKNISADLAHPASLKEQSAALDECVKWTDDD